MTVEIDLPDAIEDQLRNAARQAGLTPDEMLSRYLQEKFSEILPHSQAPRLRVPDPEAARANNAASIALLERQLQEAEDSTPEEIARAEAEWEALKNGLNENRRLAGERLLFPEAE